MRIVKENRYVRITAFFLGIVTANLIGRELFVTYGILNTYFIRQYVETVPDLNRLWFHVLGIRIKWAGLVLVLFHFFRAEHVVLFLECALAYTFGILQVAAILNLGWKGMVVVILGMLPQWICYLIVMVLYYDLKRRQRQMGDRMEQRVVMVLCYSIVFALFLVGIWAEVAVNPVLMQKVLKKF